MSLKRANKRIRCQISAELCSINLRCVLIGSLAILFCGILSAFAGGSTSGYRELELPALAPPAFIFPIVWTVIYILIGGAAGAVSCSCGRAYEADKYRGLLLFVIMIVFNFIWSPLFFGAGAYFAAFVAILMMIALTVFIILHFWRIYRICGVAMALYLIWLLFAAYLNLSILILN